MLAMTERAVSTIRLLTDDPRIPDGAGLRIATTDEEGRLAVSLATQPDQGDEVVNYTDAIVFLDEEAARQLDDKVMDAEVGQDGQVTFTIGDQTPEG